MDIPETLYHQTETRNRLSIYRRGLLARRPAEHNWRMSLMEYQPQAVYVSDGPFGWYPWSRGWDSWAIQTDGLEVEPDPWYRDNGVWRWKVNFPPYYYVILQPVPRDHLTLVHRGGEDKRSDLERLVYGAG